MTFKATLLSESQLRLAGFVELTPLVPLKDGDAKRQIWAAQGVYDLLKGKLNPQAGFPAITTDLFIGRYCKGLIVSASRRDSSKAEFKWFKGHEQAWVLSFRKPSPGWRVLGRFARRNVFVAMEVYDRHELGDMINYNKIVSEIPQKWEAKFPGVAAHKGSTFADYLGDMHRNDDE